MPFDPKKERIDKLQESLYSRGAPKITHSDKPSLSPHEYAKEDNWKTDEELTRELAETPEESEDENPIRTTFFRRLFFVSIAFFVVAAGVAAFVIFGGFNVISSKNVDIAVEGLVAVGAGEELSLDVSVRNNNNVALEEAELFVEYPPGTRVPGNVTTELVREKVSLETIPAGGTVTKTVKAVLFGEKDTVQQIKITVDYKPYGSSAKFTKEKTYDIAIKSSPVLMNISMPKEINVGQDLVINLDVTSNSAIVIENLLIRAEYPFGFIPIEANPKATYDNNIWLLGNMQPKEKRTISLRGKMEGQNDEERTFRFTTGVADVNDEKKIGIAFISSDQSVTIKKPFIALNLSLDTGQGSEKDATVSIGGNIRGNISWTNNLPINVSEAKIEIKLTGSTINKSSVIVEHGGFYRSSDNTITWDKNSSQNLQSIGPGDSGNFPFSFNIVPMSQTLATTGRNMEIGAEATFTGTKISPDEAPQTIISTALRKVKIATDFSLNPRSIYSIGPFKNTGPIPPKAEKKTTYTVSWALSNTFNDVGGARVTATLPPYVTWLNAISPTGEKLTYDSNNRTVIWDADEIKAGTGFVSSPKEVYFQISLEPSLTQVGNVPAILENMKISGTDRFTGKIISLDRGVVTTKMSTDPIYEFGEDVVVK